MGLCFRQQVLPSSYPREVQGRVLRQRVLGFLYSYAALLSHESDFRIAQEKHLLPSKVRWPTRRILVQQLDMERIYPDIDRRFLHGELRLSRLNKIYALTKTPPRGYMADGTSTAASSTIILLG